MKKTYIMAIIAFVVICVSMGVLHKYAASKNQVDEPTIEVPVEPPVVVQPEEVEPEGDIETSDITFEEFSSEYLDSSGEVLLQYSATLPKAVSEDEFAENFNQYYKKVLSKIDDYKNYEGSDLAEEEKFYYGDDFYPVNYIMSFVLMYEDDNVISIKRETMMHSNETDFSEISTETFSKVDGTLVLITDICPNILEEGMQYFDVSLNSLENFNFSITSRGIWCKNDEINGILPYVSVTLAENYAYLGE